MEHKKLNLKKNSLQSFEEFLWAVRGRQGYRKVKNFLKEFSNFDCRFGFLTKKYECKVVSVFLKTKCDSKFAKTADFRLVVHMLLKFRRFPSF